MNDVVITVGKEQEAAHENCQNNKMQKYLERDERWTLIKDQTMKKIMSGIGFKFGPTEVNSSSRNDINKINLAEPNEKENTVVDFR